MCDPLQLYSPRNFTMTLRSAAAIYAGLREARSVVGNPVIP